MLREAEERDVESMRTWRNHRANREVSIHQHEITPDEHAAWWSRTKDDPTRRVLVFEHDGQALGIVNFFDIDLDGPERTASWGFYLDADTATAQGTTMLAWMQVMKEATAYAFAPEPEGLALDELRGEVLEGNEAVRSMNRRFRFVEGPAEQRHVEGRSIAVHPIALRRENRRPARKSRA